MALPDRTERFATERTSDWEDDLPQQLYTAADSLDYGLSGALERGVNLRYPHEVEDETNCHERAVYTYSLADALDLEPRFFEIEEDWKDPLKHAWVDVAWDGDRYVIDPAQDRFGRLKGYGDRELQVETPDGETERKEYAFIEQQDEATIARDIEELREDTVAMVHDGQKLGELEDGPTTIYDKVNFDRQDGAFERMASWYEPVGFLNHLLRARTYVDADGEPQAEEIRLADVDSAGWKDAWGERRLGTIADSDLSVEDPDTIDPAAIENALRVTAYEAALDEDGYAFSEDERETTWEDYQERVEDLPTTPTGFRGKHALDERDRLARLRDEDPERFQREMDWKTFLRTERQIEIPEDGYEDRLRTYLERHTDTIETLQNSEHQDAVETAKQQLDPSISASSTEIDEQITSLRQEAGSQYTDLADDLDAMLENASESELLDEYGTLLLADREARDTALQVLQELDARDASEQRERLQELFGDREALEYPLDSMEDEVRYDEDELVIDIRFDDGGISAYETGVDIRVGLDSDGTVTEKTASFYETIQETEERYDLGTLAFDDLDDITLDQVQEAATDNIDEVLDTPHLNAPAPTTDRGFFEKNTEALGLYSIMYQDPEDMPVLFDREMLDDLRDRLVAEARWTIDSPYQPVDEKQEAQDEIAHFEAIEDDPWELYGQLQHHRLDSLQRREEDAKVTEAIEDAFPTNEAKMEAYARKLYFVFEDHIQGQEERLDQLIDLAASRAQQEKIVFDGIDGDKLRDVLAAASQED